MRSKIRSVQILGHECVLALIDRRVAIDGDNLASQRIEAFADGPGARAQVHSARSGASVTCNGVGHHELMEPWRSGGAEHQFLRVLRSLNPATMTSIIFYHTLSNQ